MSEFVTTSESRTVTAHGIFNSNPPPYTKIRIYRNRAMENTMNYTLLQNLKNGIWGLKNRLFSMTDFEFLKGTGFIPGEAELPIDDE